MPTDLMADDKEGSRSDGEDFTRTPGGTDQASLSAFECCIHALYRARKPLELFQEKANTCELKV